MITNSIFNQKLIALMEQYISQKSLQAKFLMDELFIGREAAYRRLRGDVPFSFSEACVIAEKLGMSLDSISKSVVREGKAIFELRSMPQKHIEDYSEYYNKLVVEEHEKFGKLLEDGTIVFVMAAYNSLPHALFFPYPTLSRFRVYKWMYQIQGLTMQDSFSSIIISEEMKSKLKAASQDVRTNVETIFIFGRQMFKTLVNQILFFHGLGLITKDDVTLMKDELLDLAHNIELLATYGKTISGKDVWIYLSNIDFEDNYSYARGENIELAYRDIYQLYSAVSTDTSICDMHRRWIESLRKYSTLISVSGELERRMFFKKQREIINELLP